MPKDPRPRLDLMLDLETLGIDSNAIILQVAYKNFVLFKDAPDIEIKTNIHLTTFGNILLGRTSDYETIQWWHKPERADALHSIKENDRNAMDAQAGLLQVYDELTQLCKKYQTYIWCCGYDFDLRILDSAMRDAVTAAGKTYRTPWDFWRKRCVRTITEVFGLVNFQYEKQPQPHDALADCINQIDQVFAVRERLSELCPD